VVRFINEGRVVIQGATKGEDDVNPVTSENIERVGAIGSHVACLLAVFATKFSTRTSPVRLLMGAAAVIL
jgi:hypothetical protein